MLRRLAIFFICFWTLPREIVQRLHAEIKPGSEGRLIALGGGYFASLATNSFSDSVRSTTRHPERSARVPSGNETSSE